MSQFLFGLTAFLCLVAAAIWARSARLRYRIWTRVEKDFGESDASELSLATFVKDSLATTVYLIGAAGSALAAARDAGTEAWGYLLLLVPAIGSVIFGRGFVRHARLASGRWQLERRAEETLSQQELAPKRWAERLAPASLPEVDGFEMGRVYQAGSGLMAGDFYDVVRLGPTRLAAVIGDVTGSGIEASITAFQAKYLLRVFLDQFKDPAQAIEELNKQMSDQDRWEEFISLAVVVFDTEAGTLRYCSAGHPALWLWHDRDVRPLRSTGPLVMMDPSGHFHSREVELEDGDLCVLYTDGLAEARSGEDLFGEERIATVIRKDPGRSPLSLCKDLLEAANDFAASPVSDDVAILVIRRNSRALAADR